MLYPEDKKFLLRVSRYLRSQFEFFSYDYGKISKDRDSSLRLWKQWSGDPTWRGIYFRHLLSYAYFDKLWAKQKRWEPVTNMLKKMEKGLQ